MTTLAANLATTAPQPLLPALARFAIAVAVGLALTAVWVAAETQSRHAVDATEIAMSPNVRHVMLPEVRIVGTRIGAKHRAG